MQLDQKLNQDALGIMDALACVMFILNLCDLYDQFYLIPVRNFNLLSRTIE